MSEPVKETRRKLPPGPGRPKGMPNKTTALLKDAILRAADEAGGPDGLIGYLRAQAVENPAPFMSLLGKVLPMQVAGHDGGQLKTTNRIEIVIVDPQEK